MRHIIERIGQKIISMMVKQILVHWSGRQLIDWQKLRGRHKLIMKAKVDMIKIVGTMHMMRVTGIKITSKIAILGRRRIISKGSVVKILGISFSKFLIQTSWFHIYFFLHGSLENQVPHRQQKSVPHLHCIYWHPLFLSTQILQDGHLWQLSFFIYFYYQLAIHLPSCFISKHFLQCQAWQMLHFAFLMGKTPVQSLILQLAWSGFF